jgi:carboxyl-terminal processing protease
MKYKISSKYFSGTQKSSRFKRIGFGLIFIFLLLFSFGAGFYVSEKDKIDGELVKDEVAFVGNVIGKYTGQNKIKGDVDFDLFWDVWDTLKKEYVDKDKINEKEMFYGAISGMTAAIDDPYTVFMNPVISKEFEDDLAGVFEGVGMEIGMRDEILTVIAPLDETPAQKAGLKAGDQVYAIDGESTLGISIDEAVNKIRGPKDTEVILTIARKGEDDLKDYTITRSVIVIKSIKTEMLEDNIYLIKISNFNDDTLSLFNDAVKEVVEKNPKGIILDLRNNPGGYLDTAIELASEWVENGIIVTEQFSDERKNEFLSRGRARLKDFETVVLVNQGSASASEILSGALRDHDKATIVGMQTFGKGSVQALKEFSDGSSVKITVAKWLTPNGECINDEGISPDIEVDLTIEDFEEDKDPQLEKALELFK